MSFDLINGDCLEELKRLDDDSIDWNLNRDFIEIELDNLYYDMACKRIKESEKQVKLI